MDEREYVIDRTKEEGSWDQGYLCIKKDTGEMYWRPDDAGKKEANKFTFNEAWIVVLMFRHEALIGPREDKYRYTFEELK